MINLQEILCSDIGLCNVLITQVTHFQKVLDCCKVEMQIMFKTQNWKQCSIQFQALQAYTCDFVLVMLVDIFVIANNGL